MLLEKGADVNAQGGFFGTALQAAIFKDEGGEVVAMLLDKGANVNAQGGSCSTALPTVSTRSESNGTALQLAIICLPVVTLVFLWYYGAI